MAYLDRYGVHLLAETLQGNTTLYNRYKSAVRGVRFRKSHGLFETAAGIFDNTYWTTDINTAESDGLFITGMSSPSPADNGNTPAYVFNAPYAVPLVTTDRGTYPYQLNTNYIDRFLNHWQNGMVPMFQLYDSDDYVMAWQSAEGTTGDTGTKHGNITGVTILGVSQSNPSFYNISDPVWNAHKRANIWPEGYSLQQTQLPWMNFMINPGNDFEDIDWLKANMPKAWFKTGYIGHNYNLYAEKWRREGIVQFANSAPGNNRMQAECENLDKLSWFMTDKKMNFRALCASFVAHGGDIMNISLGDLNNFVGTDLSLILWMNQYLPYRRADETSKGTLTMRVSIDVADTTLFPVADYDDEPVITPALLSTYNSRVAAINANSEYSAIQKKILISKETISRLNTARITSLRTAFPDAAYHTIVTDQDMDAMNQDFGVDMLQNYEKFVYQTYNDPGEEPVWRYGLTGNKRRSGRKAEKFYIGTDLISVNSNYQTKILVSYLDEGTFDWVLKYHNGTSVTDLVTVTNTASGDVKEILFTIPDQQGGKLCDHSSDFMIWTDGSDSLTIDRIDFERVAQNETTLTGPIADAGGSQTVVQPASSATLSAAASTAGDGTITNYLWEILDAPAPGALIFNPTAMVTNITSMVLGTYTLQLTVTDSNGLSDIDTFTITVVASGGSGLPIANAGPNQTITKPTSSVTLDGTASSDNIAITAQLWTFVSGPVLPSIVNSSLLTTGVNGLTESGKYIFKLYVQDADGNIAHDTVRIKVKDADTPPVVAIDGTSVTITAPTNTIALSATVTAGANAIDTILWTQVAGSDVATITSPSTEDTDLDDLIPGVYMFRLTATDTDGNSTWDEIVVIVEDDPDEIPDEPVAVIGTTPLTILKSVPLTLDGTGSYDFKGTVDEYLWEVMDAPAGTPPTLTHEDESIATIVFNTKGFYVLRLTVTNDADFTSYTEVTIEVLDAPDIVLYQPSSPEHLTQTGDAGPSTVVIMHVTANGDTTEFEAGWEIITGNADITENEDGSFNFDNIQGGTNRFRYTVTNDRMVSSYFDFIVIVEVPGTRGCMIPGAVNYNSAATEDDYSCIFLIPHNDECHEFDDVVLDDVKDRSFTMSYSLRTDGWVFFHDYIPDLYFRTRDKLFYVRNDNFFQVTPDTEDDQIERGGGTFGGETKPFFVDVIFRTDKDVILDTVNWVTEFFTNNANDERHNTFTHISVWNSRQHSGRIAIDSLPDALDYKNTRGTTGEWSFNDFRDILINDTDNFLRTIFRDYALDATKANADKPWYEKQLMEDKWFCVRFEFDNSTPAKIVLHDTSVQATKSDR